MIAHGGVDVEAIVVALDALRADAFALQSIEESAVKEVAAALGVHHRWELSHYPTSRLVPGSGVGLAVVSPHVFRDSIGVVTNDHASKWSKQRRIAQVATVERPDHSGYSIVHAVGAERDVSPIGPAPTVTFRPEQVGVDAASAVDLPDGATVVRVETTQPIERANHLMVVTFDMPWVRGDFPVA